MTDSREGQQHRPSEKGRLSIPTQSVHDKSEEYKTTGDILSATWAWPLPFFSDESVGTLKSIVNEIRDPKFKTRFELRCLLLQTSCTTVMILAAMQLTEYTSAAITVNLAYTLATYPRVRHELGTYPLTSGLDTVPTAALRVVHDIETHSC